jgi:hypothetical protein
LFSLIAASDASVARRAADNMKPAPRRDALCARCKRCLTMRDVLFCCHHYFHAAIISPAPAIFAIFFQIIFTLPPMLITLMPFSLFIRYFTFVSFSLFSLFSLRWLSADAAIATPCHYFDAITLRFRFIAIILRR